MKRHTQPKTKFKSKLKIATLREGAICLELNSEYYELESLIPNGESFVGSGYVRYKAVIVLEGEIWNDLCDHIGKQRVKQGFRIHLPDGKILYHPLGYLKGITHNSSFRSLQPTATLDLVG